MAFKKIKLSSANKRWDIVSPSKVYLTQYKRLLITYFLIRLDNLSVYNKNRQEDIRFPCFSLHLGTM